MANSPEPAKVASAAPAAPEQSRRASSRDASPNTQKKKAGHHRRKSSSSKPAASAQHLDPQNSAASSGMSSQTPGAVAANQEAAQHGTSDDTTAGSANGSPAAPSPPPKSHDSVSPSPPVTRLTGSSMNGHSTAEAANTVSTAASSYGPVNNTLPDQGNDRSTSAACSSQPEMSAAQAGRAVHSEASDGGLLQQGVAENDMAGPQQAAPSGEAIPSPSAHDVRTGSGQNSSPQRTSQEGTVYAAELLPTATSARDIKGQEPISADTLQAAANGKSRENASDDAPQPENERSGSSQQSPEAEVPSSSSFPLSSSNVIQQLKAQGNPENRPQAQQEQSTDAAQSMASDLVSPTAELPAAGTSSSSAQGSLRERLQVQ